MAISNKDTVVEVLEAVEDYFLMNDSVRTGWGLQSTMYGFEFKDICFMDAFVMIGVYARHRKIIENDECFRGMDTVVFYYYIDEKRLSQD